MKKNNILRVLLVFYFIQINAQMVETLVTHPFIKDGLYVDAAGHVYTTSGGLQNGTAIGKYDVTTNTFNASFQSGVFGPIDIDATSNGDFIVTNFDNNTVSRVNFSTNQVTTIASGLDGPAGIAIDDNDNIYISNFGAPNAYTGHQIHKISASGAVTVLVDSPFLFRFQAIVFNDLGELIVSSQNNLYKVNTQTGTIQLWVNLGIGFGHMIFRHEDGYIYGTSSGDDKIYKVDAAGVATVFAGTTQGYQDGDVSVAQFHNPLGLEISPDESVLYVGESTRLRRITFDNLSTEEFVSNTFRLYPNPTANGIVNLKNLKETFLFIEVYDQTGRLVFSKKDNGTEIEIDLSEQSVGLYHLKLTHNNTVVYKKIIRQ